MNDMIGDMIEITTEINLEEIEDNKVLVQIGINNNKNVRDHLLVITTISQILRNDALQ
jgi:hypothetical protein